MESPDNRGQRPDLGSGPELERSFTGVAVGTPLRGLDRLVQLGLVAVPQPVLREAIIETTTGSSDVSI